MSKKRPTPCRSAASTAMLRQEPASALHRWVLLWLIGITSVLYLRTADYPMVFDDISYLQQNPIFLDSQNYRLPFHYHEVLTKPMKLGIDPELAMNFVLRPVAYATLHLNYLFDGFNPRWYRLFNVGIHAANACLIYAMLQALFKIGGGTLSLAARTRIAALSATLFAVHPLAIESVTYIVQRFTSLAAFFFLLTLLLQFRAWGESDTKRRRWWKAGALMALLAGMFTKECTIAAPIMLVLIDLCVCRTHWREALRRSRVLLACLPIIPLHVLLISWVQNAGALNISHAMNMTNMQAAPYAHGDFLLTQITVLVHYLRLIIWPTELTLDPAWPLYHSPFALPVLFSGLLITTMLGLAGWMLWRGRADMHRSLGAVFTFWFFITIAPSSGLVPLPDLVAEHRSYLPSLGLFIVLACLFDKAFTSLPSLHQFRLGFPALIGVLALAFSTFTWQRHTVWSSEITLWEDVTRKSPDRARAWSNLGTAYSKVQRLDEAITAYTKAIQILPRFEIPYLNLMMCHNFRREFSATIQIRDMLKNASAKAVDNIDVRYQEALARFGLEQLDQSAALLNVIVHTAPQHRMALILLGSVNQQTHQHGKALHYLERAASIEAPNAALQGMIDLARSNFSLAGPSE